MEFHRISSGIKESTQNPDFGTFSDIEALGNENTLQLFENGGSKKERRIRPSSMHSIRAIRSFSTGNTCVFIDVGNPYNCHPDIAELAIYDPCIECVVLMQDITTAPYLDMVRAAQQKAAIIEIETRRALHNLTFFAHVAASVVLSRLAPIGVSGVMLKNALSSHSENFMKSKDYALRNAAKVFFLAEHARLVLQGNSSTPGYNTICLYNGENVIDPVQYLLSDQPSSHFPFSSRNLFNPKILKLDNLGNPKNEL